MWRCEEYGHVVELLSDPSSFCVDPSHLPQFGPHSVEISSESPLNLPALVSLRIPPGTDERAARRWCDRQLRPTQFVMYNAHDDLEGGNAQPPEVVFRVNGFSRYSFGNPSTAGTPANGDGAQAMQNDFSNGDNSVPRIQSSRSSLRRGSVPDEADAFASDDFNGQGDYEPQPWQSSEPIGRGRRRKILIPGRLGFLGATESDTTRPDHVSSAGISVDVKRASLRSSTRSNADNLLTRHQSPGDASIDHDGMQHEALGNALASKEVDDLEEYDDEDVVDISSNRVNGFNSVGAQPARTWHPGGSSIDRAGFAADQSNTQRYASALFEDEPGGGLADGHDDALMRSDMDEDAVEIDADLQWNPPVEANPDQKSSASAKGKGIGLFSWRRPRPSGLRPMSPRGFRDDFSKTDFGTAETAFQDWEVTAEPPRLPRPFLPQEPFSSSCVAKSTGAYGDHGLFLGRSFRFCFSVNGDVVLPLLDRSRPERERHVVEFRDMSAVRERSASNPRLDGLPADNYIRVLRSHAVPWLVGRHSKEAPQKTHESGDEDSSSEEPRMSPGSIQTVSDMGPEVPTLTDMIASTPDPRVIDRLVSAIVDAHVVAHDFGSVPDSQAKHAQVVFGLFNALYGDPSSRAENLLFRFVRWYREEARGLVDPQPSAANPLRKALELLSVGDVDGAAQTAAEAGHLRLAVMISRAEESDKEGLRADACAQLMAYGIDIPSDGSPPDVYTLAMEEAQRSSSDQPIASVDERLILCTLAGYVACAVRHLNLTWYRLLGMELLYGDGSSLQPFTERICAAVSGLHKNEDVVPLAPHGFETHYDAAFHLLVLYAHPTTPNLRAGVFSPGSFGTLYSPLDFRQPWMLHQILSARLKNAVVLDSAALSDSFAAQLFSAGLPLWAFYVMCSGAPPQHVLKRALLRMWRFMKADTIEVSSALVSNEPEDVADDLPYSPVPLYRDESERADDAEGSEAGEDMDGDPAFDSMSAMPFLQKVLKVPRAWIFEAEALEARVAGNTDAEYKCWISVGTVDALGVAQDLLVERIFPRALLACDADKLKWIRDTLLERFANQRPPGWSAKAGLVLDYLTYFAEIEPLEKVSGKKLFDICQSMVPRVRSFFKDANTPVQRAAASQVADRIACTERVLGLRDSTLLPAALRDLERLPATSGCVRRICAEIKSQRAGEDMGSSEGMFVAALPEYHTILSRLEPHSV